MCFACAVRFGHSSDVYKENDDIAPELPDAKVAEAASMAGEGTCTWSCIWLSSTCNDFGRSKSLGRATTSSIS
jgi:hypothetical protein